MTLRRINRQNYNNENLGDILLQLIELQTKMNTTSIIVFIIIGLCLSIIMFSSFLIVDIILNPENICENKKVNNLKRKYDEVSDEEDDDIEENSDDTEDNREDICENKKINRLKRKYDEASEEEDNDTEDNSDSTEDNDREEEYYKDNNYSKKNN